MLSEFPGVRYFPDLSYKIIVTNMQVTYLFSQQSHDKNTKNFFYNYKMLPV